MIEQELPFVESFDIGFEIKFNNIILQDSQGKENRVITWQDPIRSFNLSKKIARKAEIDALFSFFALTQGAKESFWYLDKSDYICPVYQDLLGGASVYGYPYSLGGNQYQLCKAYSLGDIVYFRPILLPYGIKLFDGATEITGWTDLGNGIVESATTPTGCSFEFLIPVRFQSDSIEGNILSTHRENASVVWEVQGLELVEVKHDFGRNFTDTFTTASTHTLSLDLLKGAIGYETATKIDNQDSGFELRRESQPAIPIYRLQPRQILRRTQMDYLICLWLCLKGSGASFNFAHPLDSNLGATATSAGLTLTRICQINYANGNKVGFTTHDRPLEIDGVTFSCVEGISALNAQEEVNLSPNSQEIRVVNLPPNLISAEVISAEVDWRALPATIANIPAYKKKIGVVGDVTYNGSYYSLEIVSKPISLLKQPRLLKTSPVCRFNFGDSMCGVDLGGYSRNSTINAVTNDSDFKIGGVYNRLAWGSVRFITGQNAGITYPIYSGQPDGPDTRIVLRFAPDFPVEVGDEVFTTDGCEKTVAACESYSNLLNGGFWLSGGNWMPGDAFYYGSPSQPG